MPKVVYYVENDDNTLTHYGRLGMKWGQHIFGREKTGHKVLRKLDKYDKKIMKYGNRSIRDARISDIYRNRGKRFKANRYEAKSLDSYLNMTRYGQKAKKLVNNAKEILGTDKLSDLSVKEMDTGRKFALDFAKPRTKEEKIARAKEKGLFDLDFVERTQNVENASGAKFIKEYSRYLDDPQNYKWKG